MFGVHLSRYGLHPGVDLEDDDWDPSADDWDRLAADRLASGLQDMSLSEESSKDAKAHDPDPPAHLICPITQVSNSTICTISSFVDLSLAAHHGGVWLHIPDCSCAAGAV